MKRIVRTRSVEDFFGNMAHSTHLSAQTPHTWAVLVNASTINFLEAENLSHNS